MTIVGIVGNVRDEAVFLVKTMEQVVYDSTTGTRLLSRLLTIFSGLALVLALTGVYGVMSCLVTHRTHEFGVRMALGAARVDPPGRPAPRVVRGQTEPSPLRRSAREPRKVPSVPALAYNGKHRRRDLSGRGFFEKPKGGVSMHTRRTRELVAVVTCLLLAASLAAQIGGSGTIKGTVFDPSGAVVPSAAVTAINVATGVETRRESTAAGLYVIAPLPAGTYKITVTASGFRTTVQEHVVVDALSTVEMNLKLEVGAPVESITVIAAPPELNTADARMGRTIRNDMYTALPLAMGDGSPRNPAAFIYLMPGVQEGGTFGFVNGGQSFSKDVYLEGLPITDAVRQGESRALQFGVSVEAVDQFQVETSGQSVEYNGQGSENYTIKSGTNDLHGSLFEYLRNTVLDSRGFFSPKRPQQNQNQFGFTIGGPLKKNRHCCPVRSRTESTGCRHRVNRSRSRMLEVPVKWAFSRKA